MRRKIRRMALKAVLTAIGIIMLANAFVLMMISNMHTGLILTFVLGFLFLFYGIFLEKIIQKFPKWIQCLFFAGVIGIMFFSLFLLIYGNTDNVTYHENAIIVLGSGIRGEQLNESLVRRLDSAIDYYRKNSDAVIVLSGGQGPQETITESLAMERYMLSQGIPQDKILKEDCATSTYQNFVYSKQLLDDYFDDTYHVAFVTSDYHIYRAANIAKTAGFDHVTHCHGETPWYMSFSSYLRECVAVLKFWVFNK